MYNQGLITLIDYDVYGWDAWYLLYGAQRGTRVGWFQANPHEILSPEILSPDSNPPSVSVLLRGQRDARLLVAPPEIGMSGYYGVGTGSALPFRTCSRWVVGAQVSDAKLATILGIFDYVTFNDRAYVLTNYGVEGQHFQWEGVPFDSRIAQTPNQSWRAYNNASEWVFSTFITTPQSDVFRLGHNHLAWFSSSFAGRRAVIPPHREDVFGTFTLYYAALQEQFGEGLSRVRQEFFISAIRGNIDIEASWDAYLDDLRLNGLDQFLALVEQFPIVD